MPTRHRPAILWHLLVVLTVPVQLRAQVLAAPSSPYILGAAAEYLRQVHFGKHPGDSLGVDPRRFVRSREPVPELLLTTSARSGVVRAGAIIMLPVEKARDCDRTVNPVSCGWSALAQFSEPEVTRDSAYVVVNLRTHFPKTETDGGLLGQVQGMRLARTGDLWSVVAVWTIAGN